MSACCRTVASLVAECGHLAMAEALEHEQADLALGGGQLPPVELAVDGFAEALKRFPRFGSIACRQRTSQLEIDAQLSSQSRGREKFPPQGITPDRRQHHDQPLERYMTPGNSCLRVGGEVDTDEDGDRGEKRHGERYPAVSTVGGYAMVELLALPES